MQQANITFIGCGNMGASLIGGLIANGYDKQRIRAADVSTEQRAKIEQAFGIQTFANNQEAISGTDVIVLAVKPQVLLETLISLSSAIDQQGSLIISIAAGIALSSMTQVLGRNSAIVRVMPNTPALIGSGASGLYANDNVSEEQKKLTETILDAVGISVWVEREELIDVVTAVSGSGPAYYFLFMEAMEKYALEMGLNQQQAKTLVLQTALGASRMANESDEGTGSLRERVTSPGGTTEAALNILNENGFEDLIKQALFAAKQRAEEMADQFGEEKSS